MSLFQPWGALGGPQSLVLLILPGILRARSSGPCQCEGVFSFKMKAQASWPQPSIT